MKNRKEFKNVVRKKIRTFSKNLLYIYCDFIFSFLMRKTTEVTSDSAALFNFTEITYSADGSEVALQKKGLSLSWSNI